MIVTQTVKIILTTDVIVGVRISNLLEMFHHLSDFNLFKAWLNKFPSRAKKIDVLSRVLFPAIFAFFNLAYWTFYLTQEANTDVKSPG